MANSEYNNYWEKESIDLINETFLEEYGERYRLLKALNANHQIELAKILSPKLLVANPAQKEALLALKEKRANGIYKTCIIAATGLGKTYLAAMDFKASNHKNILFLSHRKSILLKSMKSFRRTLQDENFGQILSGDEKVCLKSISCNISIFAMVLTLSNHLDLFPQDYFDYIVVDEFHHAEADSFQKIISYFSPKFFLGLTATPERMDGRNVLRLCGFDISFEVRLHEAIEKSWLTPFQYFAIKDETNFEQIKWNGNRYDETELVELLSTNSRGQLIVNSLLRYQGSNGKIKALAFCVNKSHARYMTDVFNQNNIDAIYLFGESSNQEREDAIENLEDENHNLQVICTIDIFSEGIDIPSISHILFLRPTESFTVFLQQLGRGLRKSRNKEYLVALDFIGNFKNSFVPKLAIAGYTSIQDYREKVTSNQCSKLPSFCHVSIDLELEKLQDSEVNNIIKRQSNREYLEMLYIQLKKELFPLEGDDSSIKLMDFYQNPSIHDPICFIKEFGSWLEVKKHFNEVSLWEKELICNDGNKILKHIEKSLSAQRAYKMIVLKGLLSIGGVTWDISDIAQYFLNYYKSNSDRIDDWEQFNSAKDLGKELSLNQTKTHIKNMPLKYLSGQNSLFDLDKKNDKFILKSAYIEYWVQSQFVDLLQDRIDYALMKYLHSKKG
ncbi:DEAD/DEAH box helicase [bacterium]|nr:DEAD/DEAH box helicase [bacterium]